VLAVSFVLLFFIFSNNESEYMDSTPTPTMGATTGVTMGATLGMTPGVTYTDVNNVAQTPVSDYNSGLDSVSGDSTVQSNDTVNTLPVRDYAPPESDWLNKKFDSRNKARPGQYKTSAYSSAQRGDLGPSDWSSYFDHNNNLIGNAQTGNNDQFLPMDETNDKHAVFKQKSTTTCGSNQDCEPEDLFDVDKYLPQEVNDSWFEVEPEPISVKNRHLINITKPIGVNTIGSSKRIASHDLRAQYPNPKFVVSPFLNSSVEPDLNIKPLF